MQTTRTDGGTAWLFLGTTVRRPLGGRLSRVLAAVLMAAFATGGVGCAASASRMAPAAAEPAPIVSVAPAPPAEAVGGGAPMTALPPARERLGLGTEWGETRDSPLRDVPFDRASESNPFATAEVRYNDEHGVETLAEYAQGHGPRAREASVVSGSITLSVHDENGMPLEAVIVGGRWFVIGQEGRRYTIVLQNHTGHRFEAVATVDGLDVMNGKPGTLHNRGYLLLPYESLEIDGFRESHETVAAFKFGRVADSYASKTGSARNVGVIGVAFFNEAGDPWMPISSDETRLRMTASPFPADPPRDNRQYAQPPRW